jgi:hypothetical protein
MQRCGGQGNNRNFKLRLANLSLPIQAQCFPERPVSFLRRRVLEAPIDELRRAAHALESFAGEATAERGELEDAVAGQQNQGDDAEQDLGQFLHATSVAPSSFGSACTGVVHNRNSSSAAKTPRKAL